MGILDDVVARLRLNVDRVSQFVNGGDTEMVDTDGGPIRTLKKFLKDNQAVIDAIPPVLNGVEQKQNKDQTGGYVGLTQRKINVYNAMGSVLSFITSLATVERVYQLPDASGQLALKSDITGTNSGTNTGDETGDTIKQKLGITTLSGVNTGDQTLEQLGGQPLLGFVPADSAKIGQANGIAPLDQDAKIPAIFLPSYVDDVVEFDTQLMLPAVGERGKIYVILDENITMRWSGSSYIELVSSPGSTDSVPEGASSLYFTEDRVRNTLLTGLTVAPVGVIAAADKLIVALAKLQKQISDLIISDAQKAPNESPGLTGTPTTPVITNLDQNDAQITNTNFVQSVLTRAITALSAIVSTKAPSDNPTFTNQANFGGLINSTYGIIRMTRAGFPQVVLADSNQPANAQRWGMWIQSDGTLMIGGQNDAGAGTAAVTLSRSYGPQTFSTSEFTVKAPSNEYVLHSLDALPGNPRYYQITSGGVQRWGWGTNNGGESGTKTGCDFFMFSYDNAGNLLDNIFSISRETGVFTFGKTPVIGTLTSSDNSDKGASTKWVRNLFGVASGITPLDSTGKIAAIYLPSFVDDVLEFANQAAFPATGETGKIYVTLDNNKTYRWSGSAYVNIAASPGSTDAVTEGSSNLYFTASRVLGTVLTGLVTNVSGLVTAADTVLQAIGKLQNQINAIPYDVSGGIAGKPAASDLGLIHLAIRGFTIKSGTASGVAYLGVAPTASYTFNVLKSGAAIGTITFNAGNSVGTVTITADAAFVAGDRLAVVAPAPVDTTASDLLVTFKTVPA